jgi:CBS domain-containing protein
MNVESICTRHIVSLEGGEPLQRAAQLMREHHVGAVVVTAPGEAGAQVIGIVTDRDLAIEVLARGGDATLVPVSRLLRGEPLGIEAGAAVEQAVQLMEGAGVRRLLVHDGEGRLVGILSMDDVLPALVQPLAGLAGALRRGREHEAARRGALAATAQPVLRVPAMGTAGWRGAD